MEADTGKSEEGTFEMVGGVLLDDVSGNGDRLSFSCEEGKDERAVTGASKEREL